MPVRYRQLVTVTTTLSQAKLCLGAIIAVGARQNPPSPQIPTKMSTTCDHNAMRPSVESSQHREVIIGNLSTKHVYF